MNEVFNPSDGLIRDDDVKTNIFIYTTHTPKTPQFFGKLSAVWECECYGSIVTPLKAPVMKNSNTFTCICIRVYVYE